ncbi:MAG: hypothetical protein SAJ37_20765 [Oscillatoria sp. PMC 1068.18]|nr:hypothetical protein [Oscillatoria sp. PMC 1076.18]MEC4991174.1 hypothetical protein [Oscillatoria sp. PMC 1068.18]
MANGSSDRQENKCCCCCGCNRRRDERETSQPWLIFFAFALLMAFLSTTGALEQILSNPEFQNLPAVETN